MTKKVAALLVFFCSLGWAFAAGSPSVAADNAVQKKLEAKSEKILIDQVVAIVNNQVITQTELGVAMNQAVMQIADSGIAVPSPQLLKQQVLQRLILETLAMELASSTGIEVSELEVTHTIDDLLADNKTTLAKLSEALANYHITMAEYRDTIHRQLIMTRLERATVAGNIMVTPQEIDDFLALQAQQPNPDAEYDIAHILLVLPENPTPEAVSLVRQKAQQIVMDIRQGKITFAAAAAQYSSAEDALKGGDLGAKPISALPEIFASELGHVKVGEIVGPLQNQYGVHIFMLKSIQAVKEAPHFVRQYHLKKIVIHSSPLVDDDHAVAALDHLKATIENGADFGKVAALHSEDPASSSKNGDLGWVSLAALNDPGLQTAVQTTPENKVSSPIKVQGGWAIVMVVGQKEQDDTAMFKREQAAQLIFQQKAENALQLWQDKIRGDAYIRILIPSLRPSSTQ